jgi:hypothetical protein
MDRMRKDIDKWLFDYKFYVNNYGGATYKIYTIFERAGELFVQLSIKNNLVHYGFGDVVSLDYFTQTHEIFNEGNEFSKAFRVNDEEMEEIVNSVIEYAEGN